jgi:nucleotide-binding universal stress UspA family protein
MYSRVAWFTDLSERSSVCRSPLGALAGLGNARVQVVVGTREVLADSDPRRTEAEALARQLHKEEGWVTSVHVEQASLVDLATVYGGQNDLLVLGRTGNTGLDRLLLGSTAHTVLRSAPCSVLVVGGRPFSKLKRVLCPVEVDAPALAPVVHAARLSLQSGAFCTFLSVLPRGDEVTADERLASLESLVRGALEPSLRQQLWARYEVGHADEPAQGICAVAEDVDLVVMGSRGRTGIARIILGSVSEKVASRAPVPVMVARGPAG